MQPAHVPIHLRTDGGKLLRLPEIMAKTGFADGTVRSKYHAGTLEPVWKLGRRLVAWEADLDAWLAAAQQRTTKRPQLRTDELSGLADMLTELPDLEPLKRLILREMTIRAVMVETGEPRDIVTDLADASDSMGQEAVLGLTDGAPTTLRDAVVRYVDMLGDDGEGTETPKVVVIDELTSILNYPYPGVAGSELEADEDSEDETMILRVNGREVYRANHDVHGYAGMSAAREAAEAVLRALAE